jgi:DNA-binding NtrC family response regulator
MQRVLIIDGESAITDSLAHILREVYDVRIATEA